MQLASAFEQPAAAFLQGWTSDTVLAYVPVQRTTPLPSIWACLYSVIALRSTQQAAHAYSACAGLTYCCPNHFPKRLDVNIFHRILHHTASPVFAKEYATEVAVEHALGSSECVSKGTYETATWGGFVYALCVFV